MVDQLLDPTQFDEWYRKTGRPFVTLSWAQSIDGSLTLKQGESSPVSCSKSMEMTHQLRAMHDGILVGIGTALADNPRLTARFQPANGNHQPRPIVLDSQLRISESMRLFSHPKQPIIATTRRNGQIEKSGLQNHRADVISLPATTNQKVDLLSLLYSLGEKGLRSIMVEGGGQVITSFLNDNLANIAIITVAPVFAGGYNVTQTVNQTHWHKLPRLQDIQTYPCGSDFVLKGEF